MNNSMHSCDTGLRRMPVTDIVVSHDAEKIAGQDITRCCVGEHTAKHSNALQHNATH